jgi:hypothetical protein
LTDQLPTVLAGPILRRTDVKKFYLWLCTSIETELKIEVETDGALVSVQSSVQTLALGKKAWVHLLEVTAASSFPFDQIINYNILLQMQDTWRSICELCPSLLYPQQNALNFTIDKNLSNVLHGSCRKPHHSSEDTLKVVDQLIEENLTQPTFRPQILMMSGDQVYCDDVSGPTLQALNQVSEILELHEEQFTGSEISSSVEIFSNEHCYYQRESWLPSYEFKSFFGTKKTPIFTSRFCHNHLISYKEVIAMYLLTWSPVLWDKVNFNIEPIKEQFHKQFTLEALNLSEFIKGLAKVQRLLAHVPTYMIFDDHDITDDWNLTAEWETQSQKNPFSRQVIGNTLMGYFIFQGWGNNPEQFDGELLECISRFHQKPSHENLNQAHSELIDYEDWHYTVDTHPKTVVLNTRTRRWWSESNSDNPSGLLDWEGLAELQQELKDQKAVILVSPAPIFGVKFIETVQRVFTFFGAPLAVDAENWMAHPGSANSILNIFKSRKTPKHFIILSGDVHYSFVYDVELKFRQNSPKIWQITCSGLKNEFPEPLITWLGRINRWLYAKHSPLNWFTKRRRMLISQRNHTGCHYKKLWNKSGIGYVEIGKDGSAESISVLDAKNNKVTFK